MSFTRAAEELNCTQAAISQRVRSLEHFFARPLFHRRNNGLELTEVGAAYLPGITEALDRAETATQGLVGARAHKSVTISAPLSFVALWLSTHLRGFTEANPQIEVRLNSTIWTDPNIELADLSILMLDAASPPAGAVRLGEERLTLVCDPENARRASRKPTSAWVNSVRPIYVQGKMQLLDLWASQNDVTIAPEVAPIRVDNAATALEIASSAGGITAVISTYAAAYLSSGRLVAPFGEGNVLPAALHVVPNQQQRLSKSASSFTTWLSEQIPFTAQVQPFTEDRRT